MQLLDECAALLADLAQRVDDLECRCDKQAAEIVQLRQQSVHAAPATDDSSLSLSARIAAVRSTKEN
jgi:hypothetical protein